MNSKEFLVEYFERYKKIFNEVDITDVAIEMSELLKEVSKNGRKVMFAGNGASAAIASHAALDFTKQGKIRSIAFNDAAFITAFGNDYGYENWVAKAIEHHAVPGDAVVLISSSGTSPNIVNAAKAAREMGLHVVTFSGFNSENPLKQQGHVNFWLESKAYNVIENMHQIWMLAVCDNIIGKAEYSVS